MGYLKDKKWNKKYPGFYEYVADHHKLETTISVEEGTFAKTEDGYVLLAVITALDDLKDPPPTDTLISWELHSKEYERWVSSDKSNIKTLPTVTESMICDLLDDPNKFNCSQELSTVLKGCFKGVIAFSGSKMMGEVYQRNFDFFLESTFKGLEIVKQQKLSTDPIVSLTSAKKGGGSYQQTEAQKLADRLQFLYQQLKNFSPNPDGVEPTIASLCSVLGYCEGDEDDRTYFDVIKLLNWLNGHPIQ